MTKRESIESLRDGIVGDAQGVAVAILATGAFLGALVGIAFCYYDLSASYYGWGAHVASVINLPNVELLGYVVTGLPTLIQMIWVAAKTAGVPIADHRMFSIFFWLSVTFDTVLDVAQMTDGTIGGTLVVAIVAIVGFALLSEFLIIFMGSVAIGLVMRLINEPGLWDFSEVTGHVKRQGQQQHRQQSRRN